MTRRESEQIVGHAKEETVIPWAEGNGLWHVIGQAISGLAGVDVATFFVQNPYTCDTADGVAVHIGYRVQVIQPAMEELVKAGLLQATDLGGIRVYQLTDDPHYRQTLQQYVAWLREGYHWARMAIDK